MSYPLEDGEEEGTSNNVYYLTIYRWDGKRIKTHRQNQLCRPCWLTWMEEHADWKDLLVLTQPSPGPEEIPLGSPSRSKLVKMWDFLIQAKVLPQRPHPIWATYTEIEGPPAELVESVRNDIAKLRGKLGDLTRAYPVWRERVEHAQGALTCVLVALHESMEEMQAHHKKWGHKPDWLRPKKE